MGKIVLEYDTCQPKFRAKPKIYQATKLGDEIEAHCSLYFLNASLYKTYYEADERHYSRIMGVWGISKKYSVELCYRPLKLPDLTNGVKGKVELCLKVKGLNGESTTHVLGQYYSQKKYHFSLSLNGGQLTWEMRKRSSGDSAKWFLDGNGGFFSSVPKNGIYTLVGPMLNPNIGSITENVKIYASISAESFISKDQLCLELVQ